MWFYTNYSSDLGFWGFEDWFYLYLNNWDDDWLGYFNEFDF